MAVKSIVFASQIDLPVDADHEKSPIRNREIVSHIDSEKHIQNSGLSNQMLVMTAAGPRMMTPVVRCNGVDELRYSCDCRLVFDDAPPQPDADVVIRCFKNGVTEIPNEGTILNIPNWTLEYDHVTTFFRFVPEKVYDCDLSQLVWAIVDNTAASLSQEVRLIGGKRNLDLYFNMTAHTPFDDYLVTGIGAKLTNMMRVRIIKTV